MKRELVVGIVFVTLLGLLLGATIWVKNPNFFKRERPFQVVARFRDVAGLAEDSEVWVYGTAAGRVKSIKPDGQGNVEVTMRLDYDPGIRTNAEIRIASRSPLGGSIVSIHPGTPDKPPAPPGVLQGLSASNPFQEVGDRISERIDRAVKEQSAGFKKVFDDLSANSEQISKDVKTTFQNLAQISDDLIAKKGVAGALVYDEGLKKQLQDIARNLDEATSKEGKGTVAMLLHDEKTRADLQKTIDNLSAASEDMRKVAADLDAGRGTLGRLLKDDSLYKELETAAKDIESLASDARSGKGALAKLIYDEQLAKRLDTITEDVAQVTGKLRRGEGTLEKLIQDDKLYADLRDTLKKLGGGAEDVRENAPILTFASFLFGAF